VCNQFVSRSLQMCVCHFHPNECPAVVVVVHSRLLLCKLQVAAAAAAKIESRFASFDTFYATSAGRFLFKC